MRPSLKFTFITITRFHTSLGIPCRSLSTIKSTEKTKLNIHTVDPFVFHGRYASSYTNTEKYPNNFPCLACKTYCIKSSSIGHNLQPSKYTLHQKNFCMGRSFHTSSAVSSTPEIVQNDKSKRLEIASGTSTLKIPYVWLRDHCRSSRYYNHKTFQKIPDPDLLKKDLIPAAVDHCQNKLGIVVTWKDGHISEFTFEFLLNNFYPGSFNQKTQRLYWDKAAIENLPTVSYDEHMTKESGLKQTLMNLVKYGFTVVEGVPASEAGTQAVVERISSIYETIFGKMWTLTPDASRDDTAYTTDRLGAHTDNTYLTAPAGIQVFHFLEHAESGGDTLLVDGFNAIHMLRLLEPESFHLLSKTLVPHEYREAANENRSGFHLYCLCPVISLHPASGELLQIRYNPYDRAALNTVAPEDIEAFYEAYDKLSQIISSPDNELWVKLKPGSVLLIDNFRVLHGRAAFKGRRVLCGCYLPRDEWTSKARLLGVL